MPADVNVALAVIVETVKMTPEEQKKQKLAADVPTVEIPHVCITSINTVNKRINLSISLLVSSIATLFFSSSANSRVQAVVSVAPWCAVPAVSVSLATAVTVAVLTVKMEV